MKQSVHIFLVLALGFLTLVGLWSTDNRALMIALPIVGNLGIFAVCYLWSQK